MLRQVYSISSDPSCQFAHPQRLISYDLDLDQRLSEETTVLVENYTVSQHRRIYMSECLISRPILIN